MIKEAIVTLLESRGLTKKESHAAMKEIMSGLATPSQIAGFLVALRAKGETVEEIAGCAIAMRDASFRMALSPERIVDTCGTGGDGRHSLNISTASAFVVAGAGFAVAKHGNRAVSSKCGSADVLEALGVRIDPPPASVEDAINNVGIGFLFAPNFHPAMKHAMPTRHELGVRTIFNLLGPLTNPALAKVQLIGVYRPELTKTLIEVLREMGHLGGLVVHSHGWDEITLDGPSHVSELLRGRVRHYRLTNRDFGFPKVSVRHLAGGDAAHNATMVREILGGKKIPARNVVVANAAALIWIAERSFAKKKFSLREAVTMAEMSIDSGIALKKLDELIRVSQLIEN